MANKGLLPQAIKSKRKGYDAIRLPQQYSYTFWDALKQCLQRPGEWVLMWRGFGEDEHRRTMRTARAFALSFAEHPQEWPEYTARLADKVIKYRRSPTHTFGIEMRVRMREGWETITL